MIDANSKTNSFLKAIEKYAEEQKSMMKQEIESFREDQLQKANDEGTAAAYYFIQKEKTEYNAVLSKELSLKETSVKNKLFEKRKKMVESIFDESKKRIKEFVSEEKYSEYMRKAADDLNRFAGENKSLIYISPNDSKYESMIKEVFSGRCDIVYDNAIELGGLRCYCEGMSIVADETLDRRFADKKQWFVNTSGFII